MKKEIWETFAELGWLSIPFSESLGGFGGGPVDLAVIMEEFGDTTESLYLHIANNYDFRKYLY